MRYTGQIDWTQVGDHIDLDDCQIRDNDIVFELKCEGWAYQVSLQRDHGEDGFSGTFFTRSGSKTATGAVRARLYRSSGHSLIHGRWTEDGTTYTFTVPVSEAD
jgi:hypothetical protein